MRRLLLHSCCAPCATLPLERLLAEGYEVTLFFSNANIGEREEYERRLAAVEKLARQLALPLVEDRQADHSAWLKAVCGLEGAAEGGARCDICFAFNLQRSADYALEHGFNHFTTTLTVSPHKSSERLLALGTAIDKERFLPLNFKKRGGFQRSIELAHRYGLYRQNYCGCEFSHAAMLQRERAARARSKVVTP